MDDSEVPVKKDNDSGTDQTDAKTRGRGKGDSTDAYAGIAMQIGEDEADARGGFRLPRSGPRITSSDPNVYNMTYPKRGMAIIVSNRHFLPKTNMSERSGTEVDAAALYQRFKELDFDVEIYTDLRVDQMKSLMKAAAARDHSDSDCFACAILSHGDNGIIYGNDGIIAIEELTCYFKGDRCKTLAGKPKLFFIQACRGSQLDHGVEVTDAGEDPERIPTEADFLMAYSVVPGYFSWRNSARGSWFIQALSQVLEQYSRQLDLMTMLTRVNRKVAYDFESNAAKEYMNRKKQIPSIVSMLTKDVYFFPKSG